MINTNYPFWMKHTLESYGKASSELPTSIGFTITATTDKGNLIETKLRSYDAELGNPAWTWDFYFDGVHVKDITCIGPFPQFQLVRAIYLVGYTTLSRELCINRLVSRFICTAQPHWHLLVEGLTQYEKTVLLDHLKNLEQKSQLAQQKVKESIPSSYGSSIFKTNLLPVMLANPESEWEENIPKENIQNIQEVINEALDLMNKLTSISTYLVTKQLQG